MIARTDRRPRLPVVILMVATVAGMAGLLWSQRDLLDPPAEGALAERPVDPLRFGVTILPAQARWSLVTDDPTIPTIVADVAVPERRLNIRVSFKKNTDAQFPASHIVEIVAEPSKFPGRSIAAMPAAYAKETRDSRGGRLIGAAATVAENRFWIALSSERFDVNANLDLLRRGEVFELSVVYDTGLTGALLFEKGDKGRRIVEQALEIWAR